MLRLRGPKSQAIYERSENLLGTLLSGGLVPDALLLRSVRAGT
jgi:hypothetical protein